MSRDWTPREAYFADKHHWKQTGEHFYEMKLVTYIMGKETLVHPTQEEKILYQKYPYLAITSIDNLVLPATTLSEGCYALMFDYCKLLTNIPSGLLHATTLASNCDSVIAV